ncbi:MAG: formyltransferase family protein, partial [Pseudomonadota bacterium]
RGKVLNVHPSLLPKYRGLHTYRRALDDGERWHGTSVHFVTETLDGGPVIAQARVAIAPGDTEATLRERTQRAEHALYPRVVAAVAHREAVLVNDETALWRSAPLVAPLAPEDLTAGQAQRAQGG